MDQPDLIVQVTNQVVDFLLKMVVPLGTTLIIGGCRKYLPAVMGRIPGWLMPVIAALVGAMSGSATGLTDAAGGAVAGLAGTGVHQIKAQASKEEEK